MSGQFLNAISTTCTKNPMVRNVKWNQPLCVSSEVKCHDTFSCQNPIGIDKELSIRTRELSENNPDEISPLWERFSQPSFRFSYVAYEKLEFLNCEITEPLNMIPES
jgi:hypothetical protein